MPWAGWFLTCAVLVLSGCQRAAAPLPHDAYIWQRQWTPAIAASAFEARSHFAAYRVLAAETDKAGALQALVPDFAALARSRLPVIAVIRLNGGDPAIDASALRARIADIALRWRADGITLVGIEIDHDCATARLPDYARLLAVLRADWPKDLRLSITALPAWIGARALHDVLAEVDESVLQVHAVRQPVAGLFDRHAARRWIDGYAAISSKPFRVALPAYGVRVSFDAAGHALAVEAEMPRADVSGDARELDAAPLEVATLLHDLQRAGVPHLAGIAWFRLPGDDDRRAWSLATLQAVIDGEPLRAGFEVRLDVAASGARDVVLVNRGNLDATAPDSVLIPARDCSAGDGASGFNAQADARGWRFNAPPGALLRAGHERRIGWLHCGSVENAQWTEHETEQAP